MPQASFKAQLQYSKVCRLLHSLTTQNNRFSASRDFHLLVQCISPSVAKISQETERFPSSREERQRDYGKPHVAAMFGKSWPSPTSSVIPLAVIMTRRYQERC